METLNSAPQPGGFPQWVDAAVQRHLETRLQDLFERTADELHARARQGADDRPRAGAWPGEVREPTSPYFVSTAATTGTLTTIIEILADALEGAAARFEPSPLSEDPNLMPPDLDIPEDLPDTLPQLRERSLSTAEAAAVLGVNPSRIRQRLLARTLYGFKDGEAWWVPKFQFEDAGTVPSVEKIFPAIRPSANPVAVARWFETPWTDLVIDEDWEVVLSPRQWLLEGRDSALVIAQARML